MIAEGETIAAADDGLVGRLSAICGAGNVLTGADAAPYGRDWRGQYVSTPLAVARPGGTDEVSALMRLATELRLPVVPQGGNTGLVGGTMADGALIVSLERMTRIREVDVDGRTVAVDAGVVIETLNAALAEHGVTVPLSFGAQGSAMVGGVIGTNAGGANVVAHGMTRALCLGLEVVLPDGRVLSDMTALRKNNTGYDLKQLFIGAEGTLGIVTGAVLTLIERPRAEATALVALNGVAEGLSLLNRLRQACSGSVVAFEIMPRSYLEQLARTDGAPSLPFAETPEIAVLIELASAAPRDCVRDAGGALALGELLTETLHAAAEAGEVADAVVAQTEAQRQALWRLREIAPELTIGMTPVMAADVSVPVARVGDLMTRLETEIAAIDPASVRWTVGHLGDGNLHVVIVPSVRDAAHMDRLRRAVDAVAIGLEGSFSAEHGIGVQKLGSMTRHKDPVALELMRTLKSAFDPLGIMNPGKVVPR